MQSVWKKLKKTPPTHRDRDTERDRETEGEETETSPSFFVRFSRTPHPSLWLLCPEGEMQCDKNNLFVNNSEMYELSFLIHNRKTTVESLCDFANLVISKLCYFDS